MLKALYADESEYNHSGSEDIHFVRAIVIIIISRPLINGICFNVVFDS
jgi:hypothetical protein